MSRNKYGLPIGIFYDVLTYVKTFTYRMKHYSNLSDEQLMQFIAKGKETAFNELYRRYADKMHRFFYNMLYQDEDLANDFTQELFLKIINNPKAFNPKWKFSTWFYTLAKNLCKNEYRRVSRQPQFQDLQENSSVIPATSQLEREQEQQLLASAIAQLEPYHRECFILRYQQGFNLKVISEILGCPEGTVKSRVYYAIQKIAEQLGPILNDKN
ncbi:MAG: RNA polymerase sigma factor [Bacteroidota bacterium]